MRRALAGRVAASRIPGVRVWAPVRLGWEEETVEKWEYCWSAVDLGDAEACVATLDGLGDEGWELVTLVPTAQKPIGLLKRRKLALDD